MEEFFITIYFIPLSGKYIHYIFVCVYIYTLGNVY
jgi:hypothetical protein